MTEHAKSAYSPSELRRMNPDRLFRVGEPTIQHLLALAGRDPGSMHPDRVMRLGDPLIQQLLEAAERAVPPAASVASRGNGPQAAAPAPTSPTAAAGPRIVKPGATPPRTERVTIDGVNVVLSHAHSPIENAGIEVGAERFRVLNVLDARFRPENYKKADGAPLRLFDAGSVMVDLSKRSKEDMGFWHRNVDYHEIIFCFKGALRWETEMGTVILREGDMMVIPKGITHRSALCEDSAEENILLELKIKDELVYVGDKQ